MRDYPCQYDGFTLNIGGPLRINTLLHQSGPRHTFTFFKANYGRKSHFSSQNKLILCRFQTMTHFTHTMQVSTSNGTFLICI